MWVALLWKFFFWMMMWVALRWEFFPSSSSCRHTGGSCHCPSMAPQLPKILNEKRGKKDFEDWEKRRDRDDWEGLWRNAEAIVRQWADSCVLTTHQLCPHYTAVVSSHGWPKAPLYHRMQHRTYQWLHTAEKAPPMGKTLFSLFISFLPFTFNPLLSFNNIQLHIAYSIWYLI